MEEYAREDARIAPLRIRAVRQILVTFAVGGLLQLGRSRHPRQPTREGAREGRKGYGSRSRNDLDHAQHE